MRTVKEEKKGIAIGTKSFITAIAVIFALMILTYILTLVVQGGEYTRITDGNGNTVIDTAAGFHNVDGGIPFYKWILSPILVLGSQGSAALIAVIIFLLVIGGVFSALESCGLMRYMLGRITTKYADSRFRLMAVIILFFMAMGSFIGSFEECVPLVPIVVALAVSFGWDPLTGLAMSILAAGSGFAAGVFNPFTIGVAQKLAGLPMFSGIWLRALSFILIYALLFSFVRSHAKRIETGTLDVSKAFDRDKKMDRALNIFVAILGAGIITVLLSGFITALQDYTMIIVAAMFLLAGIISSLASGMSPKLLGSTFIKGLLGIMPAVVMILMASSIKYTLEQSHILDTILHSAVAAAETLPKWAIILFIYLLVMFLNFFIASGSAKAFLLIPLIVPMAQVFDISPQLCIVAFAFGDGFSNVFYPTNPVLLISLGLADVSYGKWARWSIKYQAANLLMTCAILMLGVFIGYR